MVKNYVLDTNVLIHDPDSMFSFEDNNVIIPLPVLEELDKLKREHGSVGKNAREAIRRLDELREKGNLKKGIALENGGNLRVYVLDRQVEGVPRFLHERYMDNIILAYVIDIMNKEKIPTILVSKDINLRVKADALGIPAQDYLTDKSELETMPKGYVEIQDDTLRKTLEREEIVEKKLDLLDNFYIDLGGIYGKYRKGKIMKIESFETMGISPRNREQIFSMDALLDDEIPLVFLIGMAGTGKTLLALACGLYKVLVEKRYRKLIVTRPTVPMGRDLGYLPGELEKKMKPWLQPINDNLELISSISGLKIKELEKQDILEVEALSFIRGRSIPRQFIIIDEAQNLSPHEVKTILTRVGEDTKIVLVGDPYQIDTPYLDKNTNGLVYAALKLLESELSAVIKLEKGERSRLATVAAELL
ncbi:PhoH family protein [Thermotoga sp. KOL6]|uniref:PhoH family protein n=1 Tax=Thermotoga sp. KOL6 TaxID=126741 RepID=UPI000C769403|nr:PhoH family protein [Thermotoga sp. KOL6]PLV59218.1 phosphate starvation-inducible protein PhoH [Thermotoga sp. KOL6]